MTDSEIRRRKWCAVVAKLVAPMESERAGAALTPMLPSLADLPDAAFTDESARLVCSEGRVIRPSLKANTPDGHDLPAQYGPFSRVPTYGELRAALQRIMATHRTALGLPAPAPPKALPSPAIGAREWTPEAADYVHQIVSTFAAERSFNDPAMLAAEKAKVQPRYLSQEQLLAAWQQHADDGLPGAAYRVAMLRGKLSPAKPKPPSAAALFEDGP